MTTSLTGGPRELIAGAIRVRMTWLSYLGFALACRHILKEHGYDSVTLSSRRFLKGRVSSGAGFDLRGELATDTRKIPVLIALKRYDRPIPASAVLSLRGALAARQVPMGLILTTSTFSLRAREVALANSATPIQLIDGEILGHMAFSAGLGVTERVNAITGERFVELSEDAFESIEAHAENLKRGHMGPNGGQR